MAVGIVLVHGYSGSPEELRPLANGLLADYGAQAVRVVCLPGHDAGRTPPFDRQVFVDAIDRAVVDLCTQGRQIILVGHSTGGTLLLAFLRQSAVQPQLLILAGVPKRIDAAYKERWDVHSPKTTAISFSSVARMVSLINTTGARGIEGSFPVLVLHGDNDTLVPYQEALAWQESRRGGPMRSVILPGAGHDLFDGSRRDMAVDIVRRAIADCVWRGQDHEREALNRLADVEKEIGDFLAYSPLSAGHLARCASGQKVVGRTPPLSDRMDHEPVFANVEVTTRCNLACKYCARTLWPREGGEEMSLQTFQRVLESLPHAYRVTLVGLGEPLLHPQIAELVALASSRKRRVALVTNAMCLDEAMAHKLLEARLASIAFSLDGADQDIAAQVRPGTDFARVVRNIKAFVDIESRGPRISKAVFAAVSLETVRHLRQLIDVVADLGVDVLMLTDLNYRQNANRTLWNHVDDELARTVRRAVAYAIARRLPVLSVRGLEGFGLAKLYEDFVLIPASQIHTRSPRRTYCFSPWQTMPVDVAGNVTLCDCQPDQMAGNLFREPFTDIWNGGIMREHRRMMLSENLPEACRVCPRF